MLSHSSLIQELQGIRKELNDKLPAFADAALEKFNFFQSTNSEQIQADFACRISDHFSSLLIDYLKKHMDLRESQNVSELFASSFFPTDLPLVCRYSILEKTVQEINQSIHKFYMLKKGKLQTLIQWQKGIQSQREAERPQEQQQQTQSSTTPTPSTTTTTAAPVAGEVGCPYCLCQRSILNVVTQQQTAKSAKIQCRICQNYFHTVCLKLSSPNWKQFMCPECVLLRLDPMHKIVDVLCEPIPFHPTQHAPMKTLSFAMRGKQSGLSVEVRCIRLDGKCGAEEPTWPDIGELSVNGKRVHDFRPLQSNSCLKKRKDEKYTTTEVQYNTSNVIQIKEGVPSQEQKMNCRVTLGQVYFIGVCLVQTLSFEKFVSEVKDNEENWLSIEQAKEFITYYLKQSGNDDVSVESITVSLICSFDTRMMETPVRGNFCEHIQCFSLENMAKMMQRVNPRRWRCPICKAKCFELQVDAYQQLIINIIRQEKLKIEEISFDRKGKVEQAEIRALINEENLKLIPAYGVVNQNKILQIESLKRNLMENEAKKQKQKNGENDDTSPIEPQVHKQVCPNKSSKGMNNKDAIFIE